MPAGGQWLKPLNGGAPEWVPDDLVTKALDSNLYQQPAADTTIGVTDPTTGVGGDVALSDLSRYQGLTGARPQTGDEFRQAEHAAQIEREHGGVAGALAAGAEQAANEATFGGFAKAAGGIFGDSYRKAMAERAEANPTAATIGGVAGVIAPALLSGGDSLLAKGLAATPAGLVGRAGAAVTGLGEGAGILGRTAAAAAGGTVDGAMLGGGHVVAQAVLNDKELTGEAVVAGMKQGGAWGGLAGGAGSLLSSGVNAASRAAKTFLGRDEALAAAQAEQAAAAKAEQQAAKAVERDRKALEAQQRRVDLENLRHGNRVELEGVKSAGKEKVATIGADARTSVAQTAADARTSVAQTAADAKTSVAQIGADTKTAIAESAEKRALAASEAKHALAKARTVEADSGLAREQERTLAAKIRADAKVKTAETYSGGWRDVNASKEAQEATKLEAAGVRSDASIRTGLADAHVRAPDAASADFVESLAPEGMAIRRAAPEAVEAAAPSTEDVLIAKVEEAAAGAKKPLGMEMREMAPARELTESADAARRGELATTLERHSATTLDLAQQAEQLIAANPAGAPDLAAARQAAVESSQRAAAMGPKILQKAEDPAEGYAAIAGAERSQFDLAQHLKASLDEAGLPSAHLDPIMAPMNEAHQVVDDVTTGAVAKSVEDAAKVSEAGGAANANEAAAAPGVTPQSHGGSSLLDKAAQANMMLHAAGLPNADDLPVIGPVLGAFLKMRAFHGGGKTLIRFPGAIGRIAQVAAHTQNGASKVVAAIAERAPAAAASAARAAPSLASVLARPLWDEVGGGKKSKSPAEHYQDRVRELDHALGDPDGTHKKIQDSIPAPPLVASAIADARMKQLTYLGAQVKTDPRPPTITGKPARPSRSEVYHFAEQKRAVENPVETVKDFIDGKVGPAIIDAVKTVYPRLFQSMQEQLIEKLATLDTPVAFPRLVRAAMVFDLPLTNATTPRYGFERQAEYAQAKQQAPSPSPSGPQLQLSKQEQLGSMTRANR